MADGLGVVAGVAEPRKPGGGPPIQEAELAELVEGEARNPQALGALQQLAEAGVGILRRPRRRS